MPQTILTKPSLAPILERLKQLAQLEADWDSDGAEPLSSVALVTALELVLLTKEKLAHQAEDPLPSFIAPLADGGIQLEWSGTSRELEVEIGPIGDFSCLLITKEGSARNFERQERLSLQETVEQVAQIVPN